MIAFRVVLAVATLLLGGCLASDRPIFAAAEAVTPFGGQFSIASADTAGGPEFGADGTVQTVTFVQEGRAYQARGATLMFLQPFADRSLFLLQFTEGERQGGRTKYMAARWRDGIAEVSLFDVDRGLIARIGPTVGPVTSKESEWLVTTREDLLALAREAVAQRRLNSPERFRLMTTPTELEAFRREADHKRAAIRR